MVSYSTSDFKVGLKIIIDNDPCVIIEEEFNKPGKGQAFSKIKFRNYLTGRVGEKTCKVGESLEAADIEELDMQFLYSDGSAWFFMHPDTYEQIPVALDIVSDEIKGVVTDKDILIISIAAGVKIEKIESQLGSPMRVIRAMPNTPASIMEGVTAICANSNAQSSDIENAKLLFECVGKIAHINEKDIDIFTALIGSGPAYVFYLIESLLDSSKNLHLSEQEKKNLLASMISGAANLVLNSDDSPNVLRKKVTSPGGVTQTAIEEFEIEGLKEIISKSMIAAEKKSIELGED